MLVLRSKAKIMMELSFAQTSAPPSIAEFLAPAIDEGMAFSVSDLRNAKIIARGHPMIAPASAKRQALSSSMAVYNDKAP
jgi:hypothetical protein